MSIVIETLETLRAERDLLIAEITYAQLALDIQKGVLSQLMTNVERVQKQLARPTVTERRDGDV